MKTVSLVKLSDIWHNLNEKYDMMIPMKRGKYHGNE